MTDPTTVHDPREAVVRRLAEAYDRHAEEEQILVAEGRYDEAQVEHDVCLRILRAYKAEDRPVA